VWLVRLLRKKPKAPANALPLGYEPGVYAAAPVAMQPEEPPAQPLLYRLAPWTATGAALLLLIFTIILVVVSFQLALANDSRILLGLPGSWRPLFFLPPLALVLLAAMIGGALSAWVRGAGSVWGRLYLTLLCFAGGLCLAILGVWGMLTAFII
jgi:hypothetical protein